MQLARDRYNNLSIMISGGRTRSMMTLAWSRRPVDHRYRPKWTETVFPRDCAEDNKDLTSVWVRMGHHLQVMVMKK